VLGGGVAGLSAAHELSERGFTVTVFEARSRFGGKARSVPVPGSGAEGRVNLPAEHGFRFFPGFYRHLPDTMKRIPGHGTERVFDDLRPAGEMMLVRGDRRHALLGAPEEPPALDDFSAVARLVMAWLTELEIGPEEQEHFLARLLVLLTSCDERRFGELERQSWWRFMGAERRSPAFQALAVDGLMRSLVAAPAREVSARTGGELLLQRLFDLAGLGGRTDRLLDAPTSDVWIDPWLEHLLARGVSLHAGAAVVGVECTDGRIAGVTIEQHGSRGVIQADHYVAALPVEQLTKLLSPALVAAEPRLALLHELRTRWSSGIVFYLRQDVPLVHGHTIYVDSEWALTSVSQRQFWPRLDFERIGNGAVDGVLSVDIADWERPAPRLGKVASMCTAQEIKDEVWAQLKDHLNDEHGTVLDDRNLAGWFLDDDITFPNPTSAANCEPLVVNTPGSWDNRPDAVTRIPNLFLAADYVRTNTDLASMEGANEAARRAVNGILVGMRSTVPRCTIWPLAEPAVFRPARDLDRMRVRLRQPARPPLRVLRSGELEPLGTMARLVMR
jgi:uncharacterized protein with NAD-binding domain and iron-sulfur cluster